MSNGITRVLTGFGEALTRLLKPGSEAVSEGTRGAARFIRRKGGRLSGEDEFGKHEVDKASGGTETTKLAAVSTDGDRITPQDFPLPGRVARVASPYTEESAAGIAEKEEFAKWQAGAANDMVDRLNALGRRPTAQDWEAEYRRMITARAEQKPLADGRSDLLTRPITDEHANVDWFFRDGRGDGGEWDPEAQQWVAGRVTPADVAYKRAAERGFARFGAEGETGEILQNRVRLRDGTEVDGNVLVRGDLARGVAGLYAGYDPEIVPEITEDIVTMTAKEAGRQRILQDAFAQLAEPGAATTQSWADVSYKLFQAPQTANGSDAVTRTFMAAAGKYHLGHVPAFPHDIDLRAMTTRQQDFVDYIVEHDKVMRGLSDNPVIWG